MALSIVKDILNTNSQPIIVGEDRGALVFDLRVNFNQVQYERLVLSEIKDNLPGYDVISDFKARKLVVRRANTRKKREPVATTGSEAA